MDNKLIAVILLAIGSIIVGSHSLILLGGIYILFWAYRYWPNNKAKATTPRKKGPPEENIGGTEMDNDISPIRGQQWHRR